MSPFNRHDSPIHQALTPAGSPVPIIRWRSAHRQVTVTGVAGSHRMSLVFDRHRCRRQHAGRSRAFHGSMAEIGNQALPDFSLGISGVAHPCVPSASVHRLAL